MTALWQILKKCKEEGLFQNYSAEHFIFPALDGGRPTRMCLKKNSWIGGVLEIMIHLLPIFRRCFIMYRMRLHRKVFKF